MNYGAKILQAGSPLPVSQPPSSALVGSSFLLAGVVSTEAVSSFSGVLRERLFRLSPGGGGDGRCLAWKSQLAGDTLRVRRASQCLDTRPLETLAGGCYLPAGLDGEF